MDTVGNVLQSLESDTLVDTASPVVTAGESKKLTQTDVQLELEKEIKKELPGGRGVRIKRKKSHCESGATSNEY